MSTLTAIKRSVAVTLFASMLAGASFLSGCTGSQQLISAPSSSNIAASQNAVDYSRFHQRDLDKTIAEATRACSYDKKLTADDTVRICEEIRSIAKDETHPLYPYIKYEDLSTEMMYRHDGKWIADRQKLHENIIKDIFKNATPASDTGHAPVMCMTGGGSGSGKSINAEFFVKDGENIPQAKGGPVHRALLSADDIMSQYLNEYQKLVALKIANASAVAHQEANAIVYEAIDYAILHGYNFIHDATLSRINDVNAHIAKAKEHGYKIFVRGMYLDPKIALERAQKRELETGRRMPSEILFKNHRGFSQAFPEFVKKLDFKAGDHAELYDNNVAFGQSPVLVYQDGRIIKQKIWETFLKVKNYRIDDK